MRLLLIKNRSKLPERLLREFVCSEKRRAGRLIRPAGEFADLSDFMKKKEEDFYV